MEGPALMPWYKFGREDEEPDTESGVDLSDYMPSVTETWKVDHKFEGQTTCTVELRKGQYSSEGTLSWKVDKNTFDHLEVGQKIRVTLQPLFPEDE